MVKPTKKQHTEVKNLIGREGEKKRYWTGTVQKAEKKGTGQEQSRKQKKKGLDRNRFTGQ